MGILDRLSPTSQFIEVIEWLDDSPNTLLYRFPVKDQEIKNGAQLIVRESQAAVFVHEGQIADQFPPGPLHDRRRQHADTLETRRLEIRLQLAFQSRGLLRQHQTVHRPEVGHAESGHDARHRLRHGPSARVWHLLDARVATRRRSSKRSRERMRTSSPRTLKAN